MTFDLFITADQRTQHLLQCLNDSLECRNCHQYDSMDLTRQSPRAGQIHQQYLGTGQKTCIDCHKGIAHHLPDMKGIPQG